MLEDSQMNGEKNENIKKDIQWHPAFVSAMNLELGENRKGKGVQSEYKAP